MAAKHPQKNLADRVVAWLAPGAAVRRAQARAILSYFEAARPDRQRKGRRATGSVNDDVLRAGSTLREVARHLEQNYDLALGVLNTLVANIVGPNGIGIEPQPRNADGSINDDLARQILDLYKDWQICPEVTRQHDWPSAQRLLARSWMRDGEVFSQMLAGNMTTLNHGTKVPFSLELLEADYVPFQLQSSAPATISQGIETNAWGAPVGYHVLLDDPAGGNSLSGRTKRIPADRMLHIKNVHRIRQLRGVSVFASVLNRFDDLKDYEESERIAAKIAASMAAYIKKGAPDLYNPDGTEDDAPRSMKFRPGMVFDDLKPGEDIGMIDTNRPNPNLETYRSGQMKAIAAGTGPTFSSIARTYDGTYSAQRQELVEGYAAYATLSSEFIGRIVRPVYERFIATAVASGVLRVPAGVVLDTVDDAAYMPPAMPWIDPRKEAEAWALLEDRAYASGPEIVRKRGGNPIETLEQQARWRREKEKHGIPHNAAQILPAAPAVNTDDEETRAGARAAAMVAAQLGAPLAAVAAGMQAAAAKEQPAPVVNMAAPVVNVAGTQVHNHLPEQQAHAAPVINMAAPVVNVEAAQVHNHLPEQLAPVVHVHNELQAAPAVQKVEITSMPTRETTTTVTRDSNDNILKTTQTEQDA